MLTDRPLDLAIEGSGFFKVTREDGSEGYTRRGSFFIDDNGDVITDQGDYLDADININGIALNTVVIGPDGQVTGANDAGERLSFRPD
jgi:flagellar basal-body rod protein FlgG